MTAPRSPGTKPRRYVLKRRAESQAGTRRRIVEATVALHQEVGPAATSVSEIARRAGVQRATVYNHFPDEGSLIAACSAHWRALHPMPDPDAWLTITDPRERRRTGLTQLYGWYRETRLMTGNVLRDAQTVPALQEIIERGLVRNVERIAEALAESVEPPAARRRRTLMAAQAAARYELWSVLEPLGDSDAAELGAGLIELAATL